LSVEGEAPRVEGARLLGKEDGGYLYEYDGATAPVPLLLKRLSEIPGVTDVETARAPIESVIADLYGRWARA
jgi:hypothetical protein